MKAIITGGGTGGHIYPALAVAKSLINKNWEVLYLGSKGGLEGEIVPAEGIDYNEVDVAPLPRKITFDLFSSIYKTTKGYFQARKYIKDFQPDIVLGTGGYVAGPVVLAASMFRIPTIIHEQNVYPGFTNRLLSRKVDLVALNFADAEKYFSKKVKARFETTGNPIREVILNTEKEKSIKELGLDSYKKTLLVFGGSQGSMSINNAMIDVYKYFAKNDDIQIIHITGKNNYIGIMEKMKDVGIELANNDNYKIMPYLKKMEYAYAVADLIVYRAGATGIAEITASGIPAILVPYPHAAGNHQEYNARTLEKHNAAVIILDEELNGQVLIENIEKLINDNKTLEKMSVNSKKIARPDAAKNIVKIIEKIVSSKN
ncbi:MAG: undecaprenyldiphospho-muramoylpentapeptide beta-N-acetylglucosaminyltransferase [Bacillota bacterium]